MNSIGMKEAVKGEVISFVGYRNELKSKQDLRREMIFSHKFKDGFYLRVFLN